MRVASSYYSEVRFHKPGVVKRVVAWANAIRTAQGPGTFESRLSHCIKSMCLKGYKKKRDDKFGFPIDPTYFSDEWEQNPQAFLEWLLERLDTDKRFKIVRMDRKKGYTPSNLKLHIY